MRLIFLFRRFVFAQVMLGIVAFCMAERNPGLLLMAGAIGALSWYVTEGPKGRPLPRWMINLGSMVAVLWLVFDLYWQEGHVIVAMGHFTMWLQILLLYTRKSNREYGQLLVLSLLLMIGASVLSVSMIYGALLAAYCVLSLVTLLLFHLKSTSDHVLEQNRKAALIPEQVVRPKSVVGRRHKWHFRFTALGLGLICGAVAVAVFVVMPRSEDSQLADRYGASVLPPRSGFSNEINLRAGPPGEGAKEPVLNLSLSMHDKVIGGENMPLLLRGAALDQYRRENSTWTRGVRVAKDDRHITIGDEGYELVELAPDTPQLHATATLRQTGHRTLFAVLPPTMIVSDNLHQGIFNPYDQILQTNEAVTGAVIYSFAWPLNPPDHLEEAYVTVFPPVERSRHRRYGPRRGPDDKPPPPPPRFDPAREYARGWPVQSKRVAKLAQSILDEAGLQRDPEALYTPDDDRIARALADHLRNHYAYSLENPATAKSDDPTIQFLFSLKEGHCELFASGLAALTRSIGMQSRVVTGYRASEYNHIGGYYVVRQSHAHAWAEINLGPEHGWITLDATPPDEVNAQHRNPRTWLTSIRELYEHIEFAWIKSVVAYDQRTREAVLTHLNESISYAAADRRSVIGQIVTFFRDLPQTWRLDRLGYTAAGIVLIFLGLAIASLVRLLILRRRRLVALQLQTLPRAQRRGLTRKLSFYLTMLEMLERNGYVRPSWQSPFSFAQELAEANPLRFDPVVALTEIFYEIRFGHRDLDGGRKQRIRAHLKHLEHALSARAT